MDRPTRPKSGPESKPTRPLRLHRETLRELDPTELREVGGGASGRIECFHTWSCGNTFNKKCQG